MRRNYQRERDRLKNEFEEGHVFLRILYLGGVKKFQHLNASSDL